MAFELPDNTNAKLEELDVLSDKDREPGTNPGSAIDFAITLGNDVLTMLDGSLRSFVYTKNASTETPKGSTPDMMPPLVDLPDLTEAGKRLGRFGWDAEWTGYTLTIDYGTGGKSNLELGDCKVIMKSVHPKQGGSVLLKLRVEAPNVSEKVHGKLALLKATEVPITLTAPEVTQQDVEEA